MKEWIENTIKAMVSQPEAVKLDQSEGEVTVVFTAQVAGDDEHLFCGRGDRLARALNTAVSLAGAKQRKRYVLSFKG